MGMLYRRKVKDPITGLRVESGPWWMKFYRNGRPYYESSETTDKGEARRRLKEREGQIASGVYFGPQIQRTRFGDLEALVQQDYRLNERKTKPRLMQYITHLEPYFRGFRASEITTFHIKDYVTKRQDAGAANGTINRELASLKRMFKLAFQHTPPLVLRIPHIPMLKETNIRSGFFEHEDFLALRGALPDYAKVAVTLAYYSGMRMGEVCSLQWKQVNWTDGKLYLNARDTKTNTPRVLYLTGDLALVLLLWKKRCEKKWPSCPWICHRGGIRLRTFKHSWRDACERVGLGKMVEDEKKGREVWEGKIPHDFRRTAVRNMVRAGVPEKVAMAISGHKTRSIFDRYNIVNENDLEAAAKSLSAYFERQKVTIAVTLAELSEEKKESVNREPVDSSAEVDGAGERNRTSNLRFTKPLLCH